MKNIITLATALVLLVLTSLSSFSYANQPTEAQIAQFKKLPESQQKVLAKQLGIDLTVLDSLNSSSSEFSQFNQLSPSAFNTNDKQDDFEEKTDSEKLLEKMLVTDELEPFGYNIFTNAVDNDVDTKDIAIPEGYILGVGDQVSIQLYGNRDDLFQLSISREGNVVIPELGVFQIAGLSFVEMKDYLKHQIQQRIIGTDSVISLSQLRTIRVFVLGDAYKPGPYQLSSLSSISHALFMAGGVSEVGSLRNIKLKRAGKVITAFDFYDLLINGDTSKDLLLQSGDVVFIEPKGEVVSLSGKVKRPAIYELKGKTSIQDVISMAGGLLPESYKESVSVERLDKASRVILDIDLTDPAELSQLTQDGDIINVMEKSGSYTDAITIIGAVVRPGLYQWKKNLRVNDLIKSIDTSLLKDADLEYSLIVREVNISKDIEVYQFSLAQALINKASSNNFLLKPRDKILIFSNVENIDEENAGLDDLAYTERDLLLKEKHLAKEKYDERMFWLQYGDAARIKKSLENEEDIYNEQIFNKPITSIFNASIEDKYKEEYQHNFEDKIPAFSRQRLLEPVNRQLVKQGASGEPIQLVEIDGQVKFPGTYPLTVNSKVTDLVKAAGGVTESAYLSRIDITRNSVKSLQAQKKNLQINLLAALNGDESLNLKLKSKDRVHIHQIPAWTENHTVELKGEFVFPGRYSIQRGDTLSDLIKRAGGFTDYANINGSVFSRVTLKELERENINKLANDLRNDLASKTLTDDSSNISYTEIQNLLKDLVKLEPVGRLVIDLNAVNNSEQYDVMLESGDILYVPPMKNSVNVIGQVQVTSSHIYKNYYNVQDYINLSGGTKKRADIERIYVMSANGSVNVLNNKDNWFFQDENSLQPGDTIVVPLDADYTDNLTLWTTATQILYNTAVAVAAINGI